MKRNERIIQIGTTGFLLLLDIYVLWYSFANPFTNEFLSLGPYAFPRAILIVILLLSIGHLINGIIELKKLLASEKEAAALKEKKSVEGTQDAIFPVGAVTAILAMVIYYFLWNILGFTLCTVIFITFCARFIQPSGSWKTRILVGIATAVVIDLFFVFVFSIHLPDPPLEWLRFRL